MSLHRIICNQDTCIYNKDCRDCTYKGDIIIDDDGQCYCYYCYLDTPAYQHEYYTANQNKSTGEYYRQKRHFGAATECNGFTLFYESKELTPETIVTEKRTGVSAKYKQFKDPDSLKIIKERIPSFPSVCELPDLDDSMRGDNDDS